jgi:hypothetical protein
MIMSVIAGYDIVDSNWLRFVSDPSSAPAAVTFPQSLVSAVAAIWLVGIPAPGLAAVGIRF